MSKFGDEFLRRAETPDMDWAQLIELMMEAFTRSDESDREQALEFAAEEAEQFFDWIGDPIDSPDAWLGWPRTTVDYGTIPSVNGVPVPVLQTLQVFAGALLSGIVEGGIPSDLAEVMRPHLTGFVRPESSVALTESLN